MGQRVIWQATGVCASADSTFKSIKAAPTIRFTASWSHLFLFPFFFLSFSLCMCLYPGHPQRTGSQPIFIQRILSINLDMSLSCLASLNSSVVSQFNAEAPLHPTPLPKKKEKLRCYSPFLSGCFSEVSHLCVLIHICVSFIWALYFPPSMSERGREREEARLRKSIC